MDDKLDRILDAVNALSTKVDGFSDQIQQYKKETSAELSEIVKAVGEYVDDSNARNTTQILAAMENTVGKRLDSLYEVMEDQGQRLSLLEGKKPAI